MPFPSAMDPIPIPGLQNDIHNKRIMVLQQRIQAQEEYITGLKEAATRSIVSPRYGIEPDFVGFVFVEVVKFLHAVETCV
jgi:hypothetical protein